MGSNTGSFRFEIIKECDWLGESGILWAGGRILCLVCGNAEYCDGSYDEFLLEKNVTVEHIKR
ncbi:MAG: hypothetical protein U9N83_15155 [Thermodesulfobacteriota bacterium]|nr:hypothetical protein [Thermodesulfobacteriota bacterium]